MMSAKAAEAEDLSGCGTVSLTRPFTPAHSWGDHYVMSMALTLALCK